MTEDSEKESGESKSAQSNQGEDDSLSSEEEKTTPSTNEKFCKKCGEIISEEAEICPECGVRQHSSDKNQNIEVNVDNNNQNIQSQDGVNGALEGTKSRMLAAILAIFLGTFGIHKFYLGQAGRGALFFLFSWTGIPTIIGLIQGVSYLLMSDQKFAQKFG